MERVVVCPYCKRPSPEPVAPGLTYSCGCGAIFAALSQDELGSGLFEMVSNLFTDADSPLEELLEECQVTVYPYRPEFKADQASGLAEFIREVRFDSSREPELNLVWVLPGEPSDPVADFEPSPN